MADRIAKYFYLLIDTLVSIIKLFILTRKKSKLPKDLGSNSIIILGNGPSLSKTIEQHLDILKSATTMGVNHFAKSAVYTIIKPKYYVLTAPDFWMSPPPNELHEQARQELFEVIKRDTTWPMTIFTSVYARKSIMIDALSEISHVNFCFINDNAFEGLPNITHWIWTKGWGCPRLHNVLVPSIYLSINMGFKNIYITGADHSWHEEMKVDENNRFTVNHQHFYDKGTYRLAQFKGDGSEYFIHDSFRKLYLAFKGHHLLMEYADKHNCIIYNASEKSYIDAYPRKLLTDFE